MLADTGPLYAMLVRSDQHHVRARDEMTRLADADLTVVIAHPTVMETYTLLLRRVAPRRAAAWALDVARKGSCLSPAPRDYERAIARVQAFHDQPISLFDALVAVLSEQLELPVWTFDTHFDVLGVPVLR